MAGQEISLKSFFVFNTQIRTIEGEEEKKILFYHPTEIDLDYKVKDTGFCEALIKFTHTFTCEENCEVLRTQKTAQYFFQPESGYWMSLTVNVPYETKTKEGVEYREYHGDDVHDSIFKAILRHSYHMFRLFNGTFEANLDGKSIQDNADMIICVIDAFYLKYISTIKLSCCDILNVNKSLQYYPLEKLMFLRVNNFVNMIESTFPIIKNSVFLYSEQIIWSGINATELYSINEYLQRTLFPKMIDNDVRNGSLTKSHSFGSSHYGCFITGPETFNNCLPAPKIHFYSDGGHQVYTLVVYKALNGVICLFIDESAPVPSDFYKDLHSFIGPQLTAIASDIGEECLNRVVTPQLTVAPNVDPVWPKYLYFNELSLKHEGTIHFDVRKSKGTNTTLPLAVMNLIADLNEKSSGSRSGEVILKTHNDYWIVKRSSNHRHFFIVFNKNSTLIDLTEETKKIFDQNIKDVFFDKI